MVLMSVLKDNRGAKDAESWDEEAEEAVEKAERQSHCARRNTFLSNRGTALFLRTDGNKMGQVGSFVVFHVAFPK